MYSNSVVTNIIKWFAGLFILLVVVSFWIEFMNIRHNSLLLADIAYKAMEESCEYFSQESFKGLDDNNTRGLTYNLKTGDGTDVLSGNFYAKAFGMTVTNEKDIYNSLFDRSERENDHLDYIINELQNKCDIDVQGYSIINTLNEIINGNYADSLVRPTPTNLGITYLNSKVLKYIFTWNLANKLSASSAVMGNYRQRRNILQDVDSTDGGDSLGEYYVKWNGFRIYIANSSGEVIPDVALKEEDIKVVSIYDTDGNYPFENTFEELTGVKVGPWGDGIHYGYGYYLLDGVITPKFATKDVREYKVIYKPKWRLKIAYEGILPMFFVKHIMQQKNDYSFDILNDTDELFDVSKTYIVPDVNKPISEYGAQSAYNGSKSNEVVAPAVWTEYYKDDESDIYSDEDISEGDLVSGYAEGKRLGIGQSLNYCVIH